MKEADVLDFFCIKSKKYASFFENVPFL
ncbi:MAG: hypothetical protein RLZZ628_3360, partial [Bacteroidota bacterium]